ncbi:hypothetical protein FRC18_006367 [Serendipita sp. 400]|nr:hypothetical protein FRC18_006367 [Serendipita sp. 400]
MDNYDRRQGARSRSRSRSPLRSARPRPHPRPRTPPPPRRVYRGRSRSPPRLRPRSRSRSRSRNSSPHSHSRFDRRKSRSRSRSRSRSPPPRRTTTTVDRLRDRDWDRDRDRDQLRAGRMAPDIKPWQRERSHQRASSTLTTSSVHSVRSEESNTNRTSSKSTTMPTSVPVSLPASASVSVSPSTSATVPVPVSIPVPAKPKQSGDSDVMMEEGEVAVTPRGWTRSSLPSSSSSTARKIANTNKNSSVSATASASATATRTKSTTTPRTTTTTIATLPSSSSGATAIPVSTGSVPPLPPLAEVVKQQQEQKQEQQQQLTSTSISVDTDEEMEVAQNLYDNDNDSDRNSNPQVLPLAPISRTGEDKNLVLQRIRAGGDDAGAVVDARLRFQTGGTTTQELSDVEKRFIHAVWDRRVRALMEIGQLNAKKEEVTSLLETMARARSAPNSSGGLDQRENKLIEVKRDIERMLKEVMDRLRREERGLEEEALRLYVGDGASAPGGNKGGEVVARLENARVRLDELTRRVWPDRQRQLQLQQNQRRQLTADVGLTNVTTAAVTKSTTTSGTVTPKVEGEEGEEMEVEEEEEEEEEEAEITEAELEVLEEKMMDLGLDFDDIEYGVEGNVMVQSLVEKEVARLARLNKLKPGDVSAQGNTARGATKEEMEEIVGLELEVKVDEEWDKEAQVQLEEVRKYMRRLEERTERARRELDQVCAISFHPIR